MAGMSVVRVVVTPSIRLEGTKAKATHRIRWPRVGPAALATFSDGLRELCQVPGLGFCAVTPGEHHNITAQLNVSTKSNP